MNKHTTGGNIHTLSLSLVSEWILECLNGIPEDMVCIPEDMVQRTFKKCRISNAVDGTEDDLLWAEQNDEANQMESEDTEEDDIHHGQITEEEREMLFGADEDEDGNE